MRWTAYPGGGVTVTAESSAIDKGRLTITTQSRTYGTTTFLVWIYLDT